MKHIISLLNSSHKNKGFTLVELMVSIAVVAILSAIALPSLNTFLVEMRVDNEISEMQRLLLTARNVAINTEKNTTVCPLASNNTCSNNWHNEISVFSNNSNSIDNNKYDPATEELIKVKVAIKDNDKLQFNSSLIIYRPTGQTVSSSARAFSYCPQGYTDKSRGISVSMSGRVYTSSDTDNDGKDEDRNNAEITCS